MPGKSLEDAEAEGGAADAAAREAQSSPRLLTSGFEPMDALVERYERAVVEGGSLVQLLEFLPQDREQRGRRLGKLVGLPARLLGRRCRGGHRILPSVLFVVASTYG